MKEETSILIEKIKNVINRKEGSYNALIETKPEDYKLLLDYITNLQEENKELKEDKSKMFETAVKNNNKLMDRIYNAIEYINITAINTINGLERTKDTEIGRRLLYILKGEDNE